MSRERSAKSNESITRFGKLLVDLASAKVDFAVVGGLAVIFNGYDRLTLDADILVQFSPENIEKVLVCLAGWGEGWARELVQEDFTPQEGSIRVSEDFDLDIFTQMQGHALDFFRPRLKGLDAGGVTIHYLSPEDIILLKEGSWRDKDRLDVQAMKEVIARDRTGT